MPGARRRIDLDFAQVEREYGIDFHKTCSTGLDALVPLAADGPVDIGDDGIVVTARGRLLLRTIATAFDRHDHGDQTRRARTLLTWWR